MWLNLVHSNYNYETAKESYLFVLDGIITKDIDAIRSIKQKDQGAVLVLSFESAKVIYGKLAMEKTVLVTRKRTQPPI